MADQTNTTNQTAEDLAQAALSQTDDVTTTTATSQVDAAEVSEIDESNQVAETLTALQSVIERNADQLDQLKEQIKEVRESLKGVFENDSELGVAEDQVKEFTTQVKQRKSQLATSPVAMQLKAKLGDLGEEKKEVEEALSNHLLNYYELTHSTSFDTSDGDQREFSLRAAVKGKKKAA